MTGNRDFTYSEGCGCQVTFFAESEYRTSRMTPGVACEDHTGRYQVAERDCLLERAKAGLVEHQQWQKKRERQRRNIW